MRADAPWCRDGHRASLRGDATGSREARRRSIEPGACHRAALCADPLARPGMTTERDGYRRRDLAFEPIISDGS